MICMSGQLQNIIYERIGILLGLAQEAIKKGDMKYARRYVFLARKLSSRYNCRMRREDKMRFCKSCGMPSVIGKNTKVRLNSKKHVAEYLCLCGAKRTFRYKKAKPSQKLAK